MALFLSPLLVTAAPAPAEGPGQSANAGRSDNSGSGNAADRKLDRQLRDLSRGSANGESDVIVEFTDNSDEANTLRGFGRQGRKLDQIKGRVLRINNGLLRKLAENPKVKKITTDRAVEGFNGRTAVTVGARAVSTIMGYRGNGIGVAIIDSGIVWHDDLTVANRQGQRMVHFKDFVNGRTTAYDDWGHGTHVAGIVAGNGYDSRGTREGIASGANIIAIKALNATGSGRISDIIAALDYVVSIKTAYNIRVINLSLGAGVFESYNTDPLTLAAKRAVNAGIVVIAAAGSG